MSALAFIAVGVLAQVTATHVTERELARGIHCRAPGRCVVRRALVDRMLADNEELTTAGRLEPSLVDGQPAGLKLSAVRPGSWLDRLGLRSGDTLESVNDYELATPAQALLAYMSLRNQTRFAVRIVRRGQPQTLSFEIR
jgi:general secretion pathway protein C